MADRYLIETSSVDGYLLEDGSGVLILEEQPSGIVFSPVRVYLPILVRIMILSLCAYGLFSVLFDIIDIIS